MPQGEGRHHEGPAQTSVGPWVMGCSSKTKRRAHLGPWHGPLLHGAAWWVVSHDAPPAQQCLQGPSPKGCISELLAFLQRPPLLTSSMDVSINKQVLLSSVAPGSVRLFSRQQM